MPDPADSASCGDLVPSHLYRPDLIEDYALIGDCQTAALVSRRGSIDWLCFPRFDSGACFSALLGTGDHGRFVIRPAGPGYYASRRYLGDTLILETRFDGPDGAFTVVDFMPPRTSTPDLVRIVTGLRGQPRVHVGLTIRYDYGATVPWVRSLDPEHHGALTAVAGPDLLCVRADVPLHGENLHTVADFTVSPGERRSFVLSYGPSHKALPPAINPERALQNTSAFWHRWASACTYRGPYQQAVLRSLITLKGLTYTPTGGIVAAPTTSLPEHLGGVRNWDYRYCWLRDATFSLCALIGAGYLDEARAWREWLLRAVAGSPGQLQIMYGLGGERRLPELSLPWLPGYHGAAPVRIGNEAYTQRQLDVYGEVVDAMYLASRSGLDHHEAAWPALRALICYLEQVWTEPDWGIWEVRGGPRHFTHSKVMAWVAFDRALAAAAHYRLDGPAEMFQRWARARDAIHAEVCQRGFGAGRGCFVQSYGAQELDASLLLIPLVGFLPATDPRVLGTVEAIRRELAGPRGLLRRYSGQEPAAASLAIPAAPLAIPAAHPVDGLPAGEGAFLPCTFWLVDNLALQGRTAEARELFERLLGLRNDVGLLSEEYEPDSGRFLGNFPQAFTHVALVNSAYNLGPDGPAWQRLSLL